MITSWRIRKLVFERELLSIIVYEYNRYNKVQIYIDDASLAMILVSGVFVAHDLESLLSSLELSSVRIDRSQSGEIRLLSQNI